MLFTPMTRRSAIVVAAAAAVTVGAVSASQAQTLGAAADFNAFFFGNHTANGSDIQGRLAVGGNATYSNGYTIASLEAPGSTISTVIGGNFTNRYNSVQGSIIAGGDIQYSGPSIYGNVTARGKVDFSGGGGQVNGNIAYGTTYTGPGYTINSGYTTQAVSPASITLPVDFTAAQADLTGKAAYWSTLTPTVTNTGTYNAITANLVSGLNVLNLDAATFTSATSFNYTGPSDAYLLVNIKNPTNLTLLTLPNIGTFYNGGFGTKNLLYNFADANLVNLNVGSFFGSVVAPYASISATSGGFNGQLIAASGNTGNLEIHKYDYGANSGPVTRFGGTLPPIQNTRVPEPGVLGLIMLGLPLFAVRRRVSR